MYAFHREIQANQDSQELLDLKEIQDHQVYQDCQEDQVLKVTLACQDSKVTYQITLFSNVHKIFEFHVEGLSIYHLLVSIFKQQNFSFPVRSPWYSRSER